MIRLMIINLILLTIFVFCAEARVASSIDTNKRFEQIENFINNDSTIKKIMYRYYPVIDCFCIPDTTSVLIYGVEGYVFVNNLEHLSPQERYKLKPMIDSLDQIHNRDFKPQKTNYKKKSNCECFYSFDMMMSEKIWAISIVPIDTEPGLYRIVGYSFIFDENDEIIKSGTSFGMQ